MPLYIKKRAFLRSKTLGLPLKRFPGALPSDPQYPFNSLLTRLQSPKDTYDILCLQNLNYGKWDEFEPIDFLRSHECIIQIV